MLRSLLFLKPADTIVYNPTFYSAARTLQQSNSHQLSSLFELAHDLENLRSMLVLAFVVLGAVEQCVYDNGDCTGTGTCVSDANDTLAELVADDWSLLPTFAEYFHRCVYIGFASSTSNGVFNVYTQWTCSNDSVKIEYHDNQDCSNNVSATECEDDPRTTNINCSQTFSLNQCTGSGRVYKFGEYGSDGVGEPEYGSVKYTGSCPKVGSCHRADGSYCIGGLGNGDSTCFSREAEACRILDTHATPSAAFRACFDEPAPSVVAERVKMTALTGGDYVLGAGKGLAYEFTRVIVNQHKLNEARR